MTGNHVIHHFQNVGMINRPASCNVVAALLNESCKARFLRGSVANGLRHKPGPASPLFGDNLVHQLESFGVDTRGNDRMLGHGFSVSFVYK